MKEPLVTVVIPCYNAAAFLSRTLESACNQTYRNLEILIVDDGSTDNTAELVRRHSATDPRIRLIQQLNGGVASARNRGIWEARGELIAPLDADDLWHREKIRHQVDRLQACGDDVALVYSWTIRIDEHDTTAVVEVSEEPPTYEGHVLPALVHQNFIGCASVPIFRRSCALQVGCYDPRLRELGAEGCEDRDFDLKLAEHWNFAAVRLFLVGYRMHRESMSNAFHTMMRSHQIVMDNIRRLHPEIPSMVTAGPRAE